MLAYKCKKCGYMFVFGGYRNEFNEYFCSESCYSKYCEDNNYRKHYELLEKIIITQD